MSSTRAGFLQTILANPDDDDCRLIFADYLEEQGETDYAQFIRIQVQLARVPEYDPFWVRCWFQDRSMIFGRQFEKERPALPAGIKWQLRSFERGLPAAIQVEQADTFVSQAPALYALAPIQSLQVHSGYRIPPPNLTTLCASPYLGRLRKLNFTLSRLPVSDIQRLQDSPHAAHLTSLEFEFAGIDPNALATLFRPPLIGRLTRLRLHGNDLRRASLLDAIQGAGAPGRLRSLTLSEYGRSYYSRGDVSTPPLLPGLVEIDLAEHALGPVGVQALAEHPAVATLESLNLSRTDPGVAGVQALAECAGLSRLRRLQLPRNRLGPVAIGHLAQSPHLANLHVLDLSNNPIGARGAQALAESPYLRNLVQLELTQCDIGNAGAQALLDSPVTAGLVMLNVRGGPSKRQPRDPMKKKLKDRFGDCVLV